MIQGCIMSQFKPPRAYYYSSETRSIFLLRLDEYFQRETGPAMLLVSLDQPLSLMGSHSVSYPCQSLLIPAGSAVKIRTRRAKVAICFLSDLNGDYEILRNAMKSCLHEDEKRPAYGSIHFEARYQRYILDAWAQPRSPELVLKKLEAWIRYYKFKYSALYENPVDERVALAISLVLQRLTENVPVPEIARRVRLSEQRLNELFRDAMGASLRTFRLWKRVFYAVRELEQGTTLTQAAAKAGFADYSQWFRVYRSMGGVHPGRTRAATILKVV